MTTFYRTLLISCAIGLTATAALAQTTTTLTYVGKPGGKWSNPANWSPAIVPNNDAMHSYKAILDKDYPGAIGDIDVMLSSLGFAGEVLATTSFRDHNLISAATNLSTDSAGQPVAGLVELRVLHKSSVVNLGNLADFSGTTLNSGILAGYTLGADPGVSATIQWNGSDVVTNHGYANFIGPNVHYVDQNGADAFRHFNHNAPGGVFDIEAGANFTTAGSFLNEEEMHIFANFPGVPNDPHDHGFHAPTTFTVTADLTFLGPDQEGYVQMLSKGTGANAELKVLGKLTDYDAATKTLKGGQYDCVAWEGGASIVQVLTGSFDIVNSNAFLSLFGPNTGLRDSTGADALRNLALTTNYLRIADRTFTTAGSFVDDGVLSVRGGGHFIVSGDLTIKSGVFDLAEQTGYAFDEQLQNMTTPVEFANSVTNVNGNFTLAQPSILRFDIWSSDTTATMHVAGKASLAGTLAVLLMDGADGLKGNGRRLMTAASFTGSFENVKSGNRVLAYAEDRIALSSFHGVLAGSYAATYSDNSLQISDFQAHSSMLNLSTRVDVQPNDSGSAIAGFIVRGIGQKKLMVRGIGPSLAAKGVPNALQDPVVEIRDSKGAVVATNDNWQSSQQADIHATGIAPSDKRESAIVSTLDPGPYTAVMRGAKNGTGVGLVELYDLDDQPPQTEFADVSTRGFVGKADNVMIGGTIIAPGASANMIVRAIGPSLTAKRVAGALQDPTLEVHDSTGSKIASNDDWQSNTTQAAAVESAGLAPTDVRESAISVSLKPGNYTAIIRGKNDTQGVALVEFFKLN